MSEKITTQKLKMWFHDRRCRKCKCVTILSEKPTLPDNAATVEHFYPRGHPRRYERIVTLYCNKCNQKSGDYYQVFGLLYHFAFPKGAPMEQIYLDTKIASQVPSREFTKFKQKLIINKIKSKLPIITARMFLYRSKIL